jgi:hypothetical protein
MAGSLTWREYQADDGKLYSVRVDESNANATTPLGTTLLPVRTANHPQLPKGIKMRYVLTKSVDINLAKKKFYIGTQATMTVTKSSANQTISAAYNATNDDSSGGTLTSWAITYYKGEVSKIAPAISTPDTGLTDGTAAQ